MLTGGVKMAAKNRIHRPSYITGYKDGLLKAYTITNDSSLLQLAADYKKSENETLYPLK